MKWRKRMFLLDKYASIFDYDNKGNMRFWMAVRYQDLESGDNVFQSMYMPGAYMTDKTDQATKDKLGVLGGFPFAGMSQVVRDQFTMDDQRRDATFIETGCLQPMAVPQYYGSVFSKFSGTVIGGNCRFIDDMVLFRYGDVLLMKAEAQNALGQDPTEAINKIRKRAYGANYNNHVYVHSTQQAGDEAILKERLLELTLEGKRWWDLIRFNKAFDLVPSLQNRKGQNHLMLFPISELTLSRNLRCNKTKGINRNPNY